MSWQPYKPTWPLRLQRSHLVDLTGHQKLWDGQTCAWYISPAACWHFSSFQGNLVPLRAEWMGSVWQRSSLMLHFFNNSCCYLLGLCPFECETLLLAQMGLSWERVGKSQCSHVPWLPFLSCSLQMKQTKQNKETMVAGAASNLNEVSPSKEQPSLSSEEQRTLFRSTFHGDAQRVLPLNLWQLSLLTAEISQKDLLASFKAGIAQEAFALALLPENSPGQKPLLGEKGGFLVVLFDWFWTC